MLDNTFDLLWRLLPRGAGTCTRPGSGWDWPMHRLGAAAGLTERARSGCGEVAGEDCWQKLAPTRVGIVGELACSCEVDHDGAYAVVVAAMTSIMPWPASGDVDLRGPGTGEACGLCSLMFSAGGANLAEQGRRGDMLRDSGRTAAVLVAEPRGLRTAGCNRLLACAGSIVGTPCEALRGDGWVGDRAPFETLGCSDRFGTMGCCAAWAGNVGRA